MNYIGSKYSLLPFIDRIYNKIADGSEISFCDIFAGTGAVARHFKRIGHRVIANDLQYYAYVLNKAYIETNETPAFAGLRRKYKKQLGGIAARLADPAEQILALVSGLAGTTGFITEHYSPRGGRFYYTEENAMRADAIRGALDTWRAEGSIDQGEYFYLLCSLLEAIDQVANTASVYGAYLKKFKNSALRPFALKPLALSNHVQGSQVYREDANELIRRIECDLLYLDPPYNHRQYGANYHVLETIAAYDAPALRGVTGMRDYPRSRYCRSREAAAALEDLIRNARVRHILMSYNDEGVILYDEMLRILSLRGRVKTYKQAYQRFKADKGRKYKREGTIEYLHYVRVER
jgi:adenine-specific DNA-methyltransferase